MNELLKAVIEAHGGMDRWREVRSIDLRFNFSGAVLEVKGFPRHLQPSCSIDVRERRVVFQRLGGDPDHRWIFTADRCWIERRDGRVVEERDKPRDSFAGHAFETKWDALHLTYFIGYAIWNYVSLPFVLAEPGFVLRDAGNHLENGEQWRALDVTFPDDVPAHTKEQRLYFGPDLMLRRMDYKTDVARGTASHYCFDYRQFGGLMFPTLRRVVSRRDDGPKVSGRTGFLLDYIDVEVLR